MKKPTRFPVTTPLSGKVEGHILKYKKILNIRRYDIANDIKVSKWLLCKIAESDSKSTNGYIYFSSSMNYNTHSCRFHRVFNITKICQWRILFFLIHVSFSNVFLSDLLQFLHVRRRAPSVVRVLLIQDKLLSFFLHSSFPLITSCLT